jgi:hypothetical protein
VEAKTKRSNFKITAIAVTEASQGGAASLMNDPLLLKSLKDGKTLSEEQRSLLIDVGFKESDIDKSLVSGKEPQASLSGDSDGEVKETLNKGTDNMSEENLRKELEEVKHKFAVSEATGQIAGYSFGELEADVAGALATLEDSSVLIKAFDLLVESKTAAVDEALAKAKEDAVDTNADLKKELDSEAGVAGGEGEAKTDEEVRVEGFEKALEEEYAKLGGGK